MDKNDFFKKAKANGWTEAEINEYYSDWAFSKNTTGILAPPLDYMNPLLSKKPQKREYIVKDGHLRDD